MRLMRPLEMTYLTSSRCFRDIRYVRAILIVRLSNQLQSRQQYSTKNTPQRFIFLIGDQILFKYDPFRSVINSIIQVYLQSRGSEITLPTLLVENSWQSSSHHKRQSIHDRILQIYEPLLPNDYQTVWSFVKDHDRGLDMLLRNYYYKTTEFQNSSILEQISLLNKGTKLTVLKSSVWDAIKFEFNAMLKQMLQWLVLPVKLASLTTMDEFMRSQWRGKFTRLIVISNSESQISQLRQFSKSQGMSLTVIQLLESGKYVKDINLQLLIEDFRFCESINDQKLMDELYVQLLSEFTVIKGDEMEINDILYVINKGSHLHSKT